MRNSGGGFMVFIFRFAFCDCMLTACDNMLFRSSALKSFGLLCGRSRQRQVPIIAQ